MSEVQHMHLPPWKDATGEYVVHVPCKIGDTVWGIRHRNGVPLAVQGRVSEIFFVGSGMILCIVVSRVVRGRWGINVFATKEEAEAAIQRSKYES